MDLNITPATITTYRTCFSTDAGRRALGDILISAGYFDHDLTSEGEIAVQNFARAIVKKMGVCRGPDNIGLYVNKLLELPIEER